MKSMSGNLGNAEKVDALVDLQRLLRGKRIKSELIADSAAPSLSVTENAQAVFKTLRMLGWNHSAKEGVMERVGGKWPLLVLERDGAIRISIMSDISMAGLARMLVQGLAKGGVHARLTDTDEVSIWTADANTARDLLIRAGWTMFRIGENVYFSSETQFYALLVRRLKTSVVLRPVSPVYPSRHTRISLSSGGNVEAICAFVPVKGKIYELWLAAADLMNLHVDPDHPRMLSLGTHSNAARFINHFTVRGARIVSYKSGAVLHYVLTLGRDKFEITVDKHGIATLLSDYSESPD